MTTAETEKPRDDLAKGCGASEQHRTSSEALGQHLSSCLSGCKAPILEPRVDEIPPALRRFADRWAPWAAIWNAKRGKIDKVPRRAHNPSSGVSTHSAWWSLDTAVAGYGVLRLVEEGGIGFLMTGVTGIVGIDLDRCVAPDGAIAPWAQEIVSRAASYAERSPSGSGLRIFVATTSARNDWQDHGRGIEVYAGEKPRFLTVTGVRLPDASEDVQVAPDGFLEWLDAEYRCAKELSPALTGEIPDLLPPDRLPALTGLASLSAAVRDFLETGEHAGDRSAVLARAAIELYNATAGEDGQLDDSLVLSFLWSNDHAREVALSHRRDDDDRALEYLWTHHCLKGKSKASPPAADFDVVELSPCEPAPLPAFKRNRDGAILASRANIALALRRPDICGCQLRRDTFRDTIMLAPPGTDDWRAFRDTDYTTLCIQLEHGDQAFKDIARERIREVVAKVAEDNNFDSASYWLEMQVWDGVPRVERFLIDYFGAVDTPYTRAVSLYLWTALAGRVLKPGIKADMVPVAVGGQGTMKSSTVAAIVPDPSFFLELDLSLKDDDQARLMRGRLVIELGELKGLRAREMEQTKAFITRTHESWIPKFCEWAASYARRSMFFGTTNKDEFLADETGHRRWLPFKAGTCNPDGVARDRGNLWAEARELFFTLGVQWKSAEELARVEHDQFVVHDAWEEIVEAWLTSPDDFAGGKRPIDRKFTAVEALEGAISMSPASITQGMKDRMAKVLQALGCEPCKATIDGKQRRAYRRGS